MTELDQMVRDFATEIVGRAADDPVARFGILHAATLLITSFAVERPDPEGTIEALLDDIRTEAKAMTTLVLAGHVAASADLPSNINDKPKELA